jgi:O-antigen/teichoic acid export membrane protein
MPKSAGRTQSLTAQASWILFAKIVAYALGVAVPLVLARRLDQNEFGLYKQVFLILATGNALLSFSFGMSAYYFFPRETDNRRRGAAMLNILLFHAIVGAIAGAILFFYPQILAAIFQDAQMAVFAPAIGLVLGFWIFSYQLETVAVANQEPRLAMVFIVLANLSKAAFFVVAAIWFATVESLIWAALAQGVLQSLVLIFYAFSRFPAFWRDWDLAFFREQFFYVLPFGLTGWLYTLQADLHNYFVSHRYSAAEFAVYAVGCFDLPLIGILAESAAAVLIPLMSRLQSAGERREIIETFARVMRKLATIYFPVYVFLIVTATTFITTLFTDKFAASVSIFRLNLTLLPFLVIALDPIVRAYKTLGYFVLRARIALFLPMIMALYFAVTRGDLLSVNAVVVVFALIERAISTVKILRTIGWRKSDWRLLGGTLKIAFVSAISGAVLFVFYFLTNETLKPFLKNAAASLLSTIAAPKLAGFFGGAIYLGVCAAVFAPIYLILLYFSGAVQETEKQKIFAVFRKFRGQTQILPELDKSKI